ncbi:MAG TPA: hypothetical protein VIH27_01740 [Nitrososphaerales archaeon]
MNVLSCNADMLDITTFEEDGDEELGDFDDDDTDWEDSDDN